MRCGTGARSRNAMKKGVLIFLAVLFIVFPPFLWAKGGYNVLEEGQLTVYFEPSLGSIAQKVADIYPKVKGDLENIFGWSLSLKPSVVLIKDSKHFQKMSENPFIVAFAVPGKDLIVINYSKVNIQPFSLDITLKHELCHLLLHSQISGDILPKWLDEGLCQWVSDGMSDVVINQKRSLLNRAAFRDTFIRLDYLRRHFPNEKEGLLLAYEESKSFSAYIINRFGKEGMLKILNYMKRGEDLDSALIKVVSMPLPSLERAWHNSLQEKITWFTYLSYNLYEILFALMALITVYAFIRMVMRKRAYMKQGGEDIDGY